MISKVYLYKKIKEIIVRLPITQWLLEKRDIRHHKDEANSLKLELNELNKELTQLEIAVLLVNAPRREKIKHFTKDQKDRLNDWVFNFNAITREDAKRLAQVFDKGNDIDYIMQVYDGVKIYDDHGVRRLADFTSKYVNIFNGERHTAYQPENYDKTIYIYGSCTVRGTGCEDKDTIASQLQKMLLERYPNYRVINRGIGCGYFLSDDIKHINETTLYSGDIVIILEPFKKWQRGIMKQNSIVFIDSSEAFSKANVQKEWFSDSTLHTNRVGNKILANFLFKNLASLNMLSEEKYSIKRIKSAQMSQEISLEIKKYLNSLEQYKTNGNENGAIVMNCNPFTLGHRYLIETAAKQVDTLYIFVVQEDKSFFGFEDRFRLVQQGTSDLKNVIVIPSGAFILSATTFPGYFIKDDNPDIVVDTSNDVRIFGQWIAPCLNIKIRFAGEEPWDKITQQYNESMRKILPQYGVVFKEIPRKKEGQTYISASLVRKYIKEKNYKNLRLYVPESTYLYLKERYDFADE